MKTYNTIIVFFIMTISSFAQVTVVLQQPPPYQFKVEQFWKVILINNSDVPTSVYLKGTATESLQGIIVEATSSIITLQQGVRVITGRDLAPFSVSESNDRYKNIILNTGSIPSGGYEICVSVFAAMDGREIASDCIETSVENFNRMELISPMDGEVLGITSQEEMEIDEPKNDRWENFISEISKKKKDKDWDEAVSNLKKKKDYDWDEAVGDLKKKKDKDWDEAVGDLKKKKDKDWDEAVGDLKKKKDKDWDEAVGDLKKKKDKDWDEAVGDFKNTTNRNDDRHIAEFIKIVDKYFDKKFTDFDLVSKSRNTINITPTIVFSWLPPVPVPPGVRINYKLKLVEVYGNQSVHSAMASNPIYYQSLELYSTMLLYPVAAKSLMPGRKYAWSVEAFVDDFKIQESETRSFELLGNEENNIRYDVSNAGTVQYQDIFTNQKSGLPSGLSAYTKKNYGASYLNSFSSPPSIDLFGSPSNFIFSGEAKFTQTTSSKQAQFSQLPTNYQTFEINPKLSVYEIPFGMNIYLSSLNSSNKQSLNSVSFNFDIDQLKSKIKERVSSKITDLITSADSSGQSIDSKSLKNPNKIKENAEELGLISSAEKFFLDVKTFGVGRTYPEFSDFTVSGVPVNGLNFAYNPGIFYFALAVGNNADGINNVSFKRSFLAGQLGVGGKENSHLFFTLLKMKDDPNSMLISAGSAGNASGSSNLLLTPQENVVLGTEGKLHLFDESIEINGEGAVSGFTRNQNDGDFINGSIPGFVSNLLTPKLSTAFDYAWKGKVAYNNTPSTTYISVGAKKVGPGFVSLAAPNIRQDLFQFDLNFDQKFANKKITMKTFFKVYNDNLIDWKQFTTTTMSYGINLGFYFPNVPYVQVNYSPYSQSNDNSIASQKVETSFDMFSLLTGYSYQFSGVYASTILSFNGQWQNAKVGTNSTKFSNTTILLSQNLNFEFPLSLSSTLSLSQFKSLSFSSRITELNLTGDYQVNENISTSLGGTISNEENLTKRVMLSIGSNIIFYQWLRLQLQGNISNYKDLSGGSNDYTDSMLLASVLLNW